MKRVLAAAALGAAAWVMFGQQTRPVDDALLRNAGKTGEEWLSYNLTPEETRYSPLKQIDAANVARLGLDWYYNIDFGGGGQQEATPLVHDGILYGITNWSKVFAVDLRARKELWRFDPEVNDPAVRPKICCGIVNRGLALYGNLVIAPVIDGRLIALEMRTGRPVWEARVVYSQDNFTITMAPRIAKGKVLIGGGGAEFPVRGFIAAFDARTGREAWRFFTVPGDPSKGFENDAMRKAAPTWNPDSWKMGGGATVWDAVSYDPELELVYFGTGNAGPWPENLRGTKGKDTLYAASIIAVNVNNGQMKWYFQNVPGDSWDYDSVQQLTLADLTINGRRRRVLMQANKNGFFYVLDRVTGEFISAQPFAKVTWTKGLDKKGRPMVHPEALYTDTESIQITPGPNGAHNWSPMSFNPDTGLVYFSGSSGVTFNYQVDPVFEYKPGQLNLGIFIPGPPPEAAKPTAESPEVGAARAAAAPKPAPAPAKRRPNPPHIGPDITGNFLFAWNPVTQTEAWRAVGGASNGGGTLTTAGNLVFQTIPDGRLMAYNATTGEKLLEFRTGFISGTGPPMTFLLDGKQYLALLGGQGPGQPQGFGGGTPPDPKGPPPPPPRLLVLAVDANSPLPPSQGQ
jgi:quinohemoprotein ethanol dehydrogenase